MDKEEQLYVFEVATEYKSGRVRTDFISAATEEEMWKIYDRHHNKDKVASSCIYDASIA